MQKLHAPAALQKRMPLKIHQMKMHTTHFKVHSFIFESIFIRNYWVNCCDSLFLVFFIVSYEPKQSKSLEKILIIVIVGFDISIFCLSKMTIENKKMTFLEQYKK